MKLPTYLHLVTRLRLVVNETNAGRTSPPIILPSFSKLHFSNIIIIIIVCVSFTITFITKTFLRRRVINIDR